jgi:hypothetical protein
MDERRLEAAVADLVDRSRLEIILIGTIPPPGIQIQDEMLPPFQPALLIRMSVPPKRISAR